MAKTTPIGSLVVNAIGIAGPVSAIGNLAATKFTQSSGSHSDAINGALRLDSARRKRLAASRQSNELKWSRDSS